VDDQQRQRMNRAAQEFTDALVAAYRTASDNTAAAQQLGARQIDHFFDAVIGNLRAQAGGTSQMARQLAGQQRLAREATRDLAQLSTDNSWTCSTPCSPSTRGAPRGPRGAPRRPGGGSRRPRRGPSRPRRGQRGQAERARSEAESQTEEAKRSTSAAKRRATEAEKRASEAESRAEVAEGSAEEAQGRAEEAEARAEEAQEQSRETERRLQEAQRRALEAESRAEEAKERGRSEEGGTKDDAVSHPLNTWVRTLGGTFRRR
jgi:hypothetical protein